MPKEIGGELYYTTDEVEDLFDLDPVTMIDLIKEDKLTAKKIGGEWLVPETAVKEYRDTIEKEKK